MSQRGRQYARAVMVRLPSEAEAKAVTDATSKIAKLTGREPSGTQLFRMLLALHPKGLTKDEAATAWEAVDKYDAEKGTE